MDAATQAPTGRPLPLPRFLFALLVAGAILQVAWYYPRVPEVMASHFGGDGRPNAWSSRSVFFAFEVGGVLLVALITQGAPWLLRVAPHLVNLRHKNYWLAPDWRAQTQSFFATAFAWLGCALLAFLLAVMELAIRANLGVSRRLDPAIWWLLAGFGIFFAVWLTVMLMRFGKPA